MTQQAALALGKRVWQLPGPSWPLSWALSVPFKPFPSEIGQCFPWSRSLFISKEEQRGRVHSRKVHTSGQIPAEATPRHPAWERGSLSDGSSEPRRGEGIGV